MKKKRFVVEDFEKMMFHQLEQSVPDYLIIDFYSDALKNVGYLDKEIAITISPIIEQSRIKDELTFTRILDHSDNEKYLSEWRKALQEFKKRIQPYFNNNQIIINFCELTTKYYDENKKVQSYQNLDRIHAYNAFWNQLNEEFLKEFPGALKLDMLESGYIGDAAYPFGHSVSHYETGYYKEMFEKVKQLTEFA